jgi:hypothetical protein
MMIKMPATIARTAIPVLKYVKLKLIRGMSPVKMSHTASNNNPMLLFMVRLLYWWWRGPVVHGDGLAEHVP